MRMWYLPVNFEEMRIMDEFCSSSFWSTDEVWNSDDPDFTLCFEKTVLVWVPCLFLWIFLPLEIYTLRQSKSLDIPLNVYNVTKLIAIAILATIAFTDTVSHVLLRHTYISVDLYSPLIKFATFVLFFGLTYANTRYGVRSSPILFLFSFILAIFGAPQFRTEIRSRWSVEKRHGTVEFVSYIIYYPVVLLVFLMNCFIDSRPRFTKHSYDNDVCPETESSFLSQLFFTWFNSFAWKGYKKPLTNENLWNLEFSKSASGIIPKFEKNWKKALEKKKKVPKFQVEYAAEEDEGSRLDRVQINKTDKNAKEVSVLPVLCRTYIGILILGAILKLFQDILIFVSPEILSLLIEFMSSDDPSWKGYLYAVSLFVVAFIRSLVSAQYNHKMNIVGIRFRICLVSVIFKKALRITNGARRDFTVGEIVNLMSVDGEAVVDFMTDVNLMWSTPLQILLALFFLWQILGPSVLAGLVFMIILIPINGLIASKLQSLQFKQMTHKDERIKLMNEILSGIKVLKFYAWEPYFEKQVLQIRKKETRVLRKQAYLNAAIEFIWNSTPFLVSFITFAVYVLSSNVHVLDAKTAFVSLSLFNILRYPLMALPMMISNWTQSNVSIKRINEFLKTEDLNLDDVTKDNRHEALVIENGSFSWEHTKGLSTLHCINIKVDPGKLVAVVGPVGCGKSSLISAFLGEMYKLSGVVNTIGTIAYVPQQAWIQNTTLKNNITFGDDSNDVYYNSILKACALEEDLDMLPAGDSTEIGEKGINLSGGQKQRISLARAVFNGADIYFLDDPLSAVDSHVGRHLFDQVIGPNGLLKNKTRVLVTHSITYLSQVDFIVVLKDGSISEYGSFQELLFEKGNFSKYLDTCFKEPSGFESISNEQRKAGIVESGRITSTNRQKLTYESEKQLEKSIETDQLMAGQKLITEEDTATGSVKWQVYLYYLRSFGLFWAFASILLTITSNAFSMASSVLLSKWSSDTTAVTLEGIQDTSTRNFYLSIYAAFGLSQAISTLLEGLFVASGMTAASKNLHRFMLFRILRAPLSFFDTTPSGRIINRFGKDIENVDSDIPQVIHFLMISVFELLSTLFIITYGIPSFVLIILPLGALYYLIQQIYVTVTRQLKRMSSVAHSSIFSHFTETIHGVQSIRAYHLQDKFIKQSEDKMDFNTRSYYLTTVANRWLSVRLEALGNFVILFVAVFVVLQKDKLTPGLAALSITSVLSITEVLQWVVNMASDMETDIVSVERIQEYCDETPQEADWKICNELVSPNWPSKGNIVFKDYEVKYRDNLELVLKGVTMFVSGGQKVGIVGRTGAGKSSLTLSLFRIIESAGGKILIDGVDIATLGLHTVRSKLTIIPQDPVLFSGSLRLNLDPANEYSDDFLWRSLELAHLKSHVCNLANGLDYEVTEGGENFSVGQRQLICLARALLRKTKVLILDEATAAVDLVTDELIQTTIRSEFRDCTVLTIAHRLNTIMDYDKIVVLDKGSVAEYDAPEILLRSKNSVFYGMAVDAGLV